jgi:hypothetical protein
VLASAVVTPAFAGSHVVARGSSTQYGGTVYLRHALSPGHRYKINVTASGRHPFAGNAQEDYLGFYKGHLYSGSKSLKLQGNTPGVFTASQPISGTLSSWMIAVQVQLKSGKGLTVQLIDLGKSH